MTEVRLQDDRAAKWIDLQLKLTEDLHDDALIDHLTYGGMHPLEAKVKLEILRTKAEIAQTYRRSVRRYLKKQDVSSLQWLTVSYCGKSIDVPLVNDWIIPTKQDTKVLYQHKPLIVDFLDHVSQYFRAWKYVDHKEKADEYTWYEIEWCKARHQLLEGTDWMSLHAIDAISDVIVLESRERYQTPSIHFDVMGYFETPNGAPDRPLVWVQFNNSKPSW